MVPYRGFIGMAQRYGVSPLGPLGSSSSQHRCTPEIVLQKGHASFRITSSPHTEDPGTRLRMNSSFFGQIVHVLFKKARKLGSPCLLKFGE